MSQNPPPPGKRRINYDMIVAASAIVISLSALVVSIYEAQVTRRQQYASVWPYLFHGASFQSESGFLYSVENVGMGPAMIREVRMEVDGQSFNDLQAFLAEIIGVPADSIYDFQYATLPGVVLRPGGELTALEVKRSDYARKLFQTQGRWRVEICYCSMFQDCWTIPAFGDPVRVDQCHH